jgi:hypothetical protein
MMMTVTVVIVMTMPMAVRTIVMVMATPMAVMAIMVMVPPILHVCGERGRFLHRAGNSWVDQRCRLGLLTGRRDDEQSANGEKAQYFRQVHV